MVYLIPSEVRSVRELKKNTDYVAWCCSSSCLSRLLWRWWSYRRRIACAPSISARCSSAGPIACFADSLCGFCTCWWSLYVDSSRGFCPQLWLLFVDSLCGFCTRRWLLYIDSSRGFHPQLWPLHRLISWLPHVMVAALHRLIWRLPYVVMIGNGRSTPTPPVAFTCRSMSSRCSSSTVHSASTRGGVRSSSTDVSTLTSTAMSLSAHEVAQL